MQNLLFLFISLFSLASFAADKMDMACMTEFPSTTFVVREQGDTVIVEVFNHNGPQYMPVFDGVATPNDMALLQSKANVQSKLYTIQRFEWPRSRCKIEDKMVKTCMGNTDEQDQNGLKVKGWSFSSSEVTEKSFAGTYTSYKLSVDFSIDGKSYSIPMKYSPNECYEDVFFDKLTAQKEAALKAASISGR